MTMYKCAKCGTVVAELTVGVVRCSNCGYKVLFKVRDPVTKTVKAR